MLELTISTTPAPYDKKTPEHATTVFLEIHAGETCLSTMAQEGDLEAPLKNGPYTSAFVVATWMAHHWWRLRHETKPNVDLSETELDWWESHNIMAADTAYLLPNLYLWREDEHIMVQSDTTHPESYAHYLGANNGEPLQVSLESFDNAVDGFIRQTMSMLEEMDFKDTDLHVIHAELLKERNDPELAEIREQEARNGQDPPYENDRVS